MTNLSKHFLYAIALTLPFGIATTTRAMDVNENACADPFGGAVKAESDHKRQTHALFEKMTRNEVLKREKLKRALVRDRTIATVPDKGETPSLILVLLMHEQAYEDSTLPLVLKRGVFEISGNGVRHREDNGDINDIALGSTPDEEFHTPLGDDLCGDAEGSLMDFCQRFVACAGYDLFCT
jgi:hypothetical protein